MVSTWDRLLCSDNKDTFLHILHLLHLKSWVVIVICFISICGSSQELEMETALTVCSGRAEIEISFVQTRSENFTYNRRAHRAHVQCTNKTAAHIMIGGYTNFPCLF